MSSRPYMNSKSYHPGNAKNMKKVWLAKKNAKAEEIRSRQLEKEFLQEKFNQNASSTESDFYLSYEDAVKKRSLNFMYQPPPGYPSKSAQNEKNEIIDINHSKESSSKNLDPTQNQPLSKPHFDPFGTPFGKEILNIKCFRCGLWGHSHSSKECPKHQEEYTNKPAIYEDPLELMRLMEKETGLTLSRSARTTLLLQMTTQGVTSNQDLPENQRYVLTSSGSESDSFQESELDEKSADEKNQKKSSPKIKEKQKKKKSFKKSRKKIIQKWIEIDDTSTLNT